MVEKRPDDLERVAVERKLWAWLMRLVDERDLEKVREVLEVLEKAVSI